MENLGAAEAESLLTVLLFLSANQLFPCICFHKNAVHWYFESCLEIPKANENVVHIKQILNQTNWLKALEWAMLFQYVIEHSAVTEHGFLHF